MFVTKFEATPNGINYDDKTIAQTMDKLYGKGTKMPSHSESVIMELKNVPTVVPHAFQRVVMDELAGYCLSIDEQTFSSTDPFMVDAFVGGRIMQIPLISGLTDDEIENVTFSLHIENSYFTAAPVYSGNLKLESGTLKHPIFNPTFELAVLQPGRCMHIDTIRIEKGYGREHSAFAVGVRGFTYPLDIPKAPLEQLTKYSDESLHSGAADKSGYLVQSLYANPRIHRVGFIMPSILRSRPSGADSKIVAKRVCANIIERMNMIGAIINAGDDHCENLLILFTGSDTKITIMVKGETHTLGILLKRYVYETYPEVGYVGHTQIPHEGELKIYLTINKSIADSKKIVTEAINTCCGVFEKMADDIA